MSLFKTIDGQRIAVLTATDTDVLLGAPKVTADDPVITKLALLSRPELDELEAMIAATRKFYDDKEFTNEHIDIVNSWGGTD